MQVLSTMATQPLEDVAKSGKDGPLQLFQLYVIKDRNFCKRLIQRKSCTLAASVRPRGLQQTCTLHMNAQRRLEVLFAAWRQQSSLA